MLINKQKIKFLEKCFIGTIKVSRTKNEYHYVLYIGDRPEIKPITFTEYKHYIVKNTIKFNDNVYLSFESFLIDLIQYFVVLYAKIYHNDKKEYDVSEIDIIQKDKGTKYLWK